MAGQDVTGGALSYGSDFHAALSPDVIQSWALVRAEEHRRLAIDLLSVHNAAARINRMLQAVEMISEIVAHSWSDGDSRSIRVTHICRRWRAIALKTPHFWVAAATAPGTMFDFEEWDMWTTAKRESRVACAAWVFAHTKPASLRVMARGFPLPIASALVPHAARLAELHITIAGLDQLSALRALLCTEGVSGLETLSVEPPNTPDHRRDFRVPEEQLSATWSTVDAQSGSILPRLRTLHRVPLDLLPFLVCPTLHSVHVTQPLFNTRVSHPQVLKDSLKKCPDLLHLTIAFVDKGTFLVQNLDWPPLAYTPPALEPEPLLPSLEDISLHGPFRSAAPYLNVLTFNPHTSIEVFISDPPSMHDSDQWYGPVPSFYYHCDLPVVEIHIAEEWETDHLEASVRLYDIDGHRIFCADRLANKYVDYERLFAPSIFRRLTRLTMRSLTRYATKRGVLEALPNLKYLEISGHATCSTILDLSPDDFTRNAYRTFLLCPLLKTLVATFSRMDARLLDGRTRDAAGWDARSAVRALGAMLAQRAENGSRLSRLVWGVRTLTAAEVDRDGANPEFVNVLNARVSYVRKMKDFEEGMVDGVELGWLDRLVDGSVERRD